MFCSTQVVKVFINSGKVHFEGLVKLLRYIRYNNNMGLIYYAKIQDSTLSNLLIQSIINTENQFMVFSDYRHQGCTDTGISTGSYIVFYKGGTIDHFIHVTYPISQAGAEVSTVQHALHEYL